MNPIIIFLIGLLLPTAKPCLVGFSSDGGPKGLLRGETGIECLQSIPALENKIKFANFFLRSKQVSDFLTLTSELKPFLPHLDYLLGTEKPISYLVLLQNDREMRANGGFFGSYAKIIIPHSPRRISSEAKIPGTLGTGGYSDRVRYNISFHDIYVPDGALVGHVDPPAPIQTAFKQGWFRLRDSDWEPDFPTAAKTIRWFFEKGGEINPDILVTLNLTTIEKIMKVVGEVEVPEFNFKLNSDNLYTLLQNQAEINFFPGSTQKQNVLTAVGSALTKKLTSLSAKGGSASGGKLDQFLQIGQILLDQLNHSNLLVNSTAPDIQEIILAKKWGGRITIPACGDATAVTPPELGGKGSASVEEGVPNNCINDTVLLVETNLGANKANCCVDRSTKHTITRSTPNEAIGEVGSITHLIELTFTNISPLENPLPPRFYGGNYISYLRYYLPENARNIRLTAQPTLPKTLSQYPAPFDGINQKSFDLKFAYEMREIGFFHTTAAGTKSAIQLSYDLPLDNLGGDPISQYGRGATRPYQLNLLKQNGLESSPAEINLFGKSSSTNLETNYSTSSPLQSSP